MTKVEELQARSVEKIFDSKEKAKRYSKEQDKEETRHLLNIGGIDRSIEEWEIQREFDKTLKKVELKEL